MPWYGWLLLALLLLVAISGVSFWAVRRVERGRRFLHLSMRGKLRFTRALLKDRAVPWYAKGLLVVVAGYIVSPLDLIPDFIPVVGQADDVAVVIGAVALLLLLVPAEQFEAALAVAEEQERVRDAEEVSDGV